LTVCKPAGTGAKQPHLTGPSERDPHHELLNLVQRCALPIAFPVKAVTEEIPPDPADPPVLSTSHFWKLGSRTRRRKLKNPVNFILDAGPEFATKGDDESTLATFTQSRKKWQSGRYRLWANIPPHSSRILGGCQYSTTHRTDSDKPDLLQNVQRSDISARSKHRIIEKYTIISWGYEKNLAERKTISRSTEMFHCVSF
jgi:hypothetical protein